MALSPGSDQRIQAAGGQPTGRCREMAHCQRAEARRAAALRPGRAARELKTTRYALWEPEETALLDSGVPGQPGVSRAALIACRTSRPSGDATLTRFRRIAACAFGGDSYAKLWQAPGVLYGLTSRSGLGAARILARQRWTWRAGFEGHLYGDVRRRPGAPI